MLTPSPSLLPRGQRNTFFLSSRDSGPEKNRIRQMSTNNLCFMHTHKRVEAEALAYWINLMAPLEADFQMSSADLP